MKDKNGTNLEIGDKVFTWSPDDIHQDVMGEVIKFVGAKDITSAAYIQFSDKDVPSLHQVQVRFDREMVKVPSKMDITVVSSTVNDHVCSHCKNERCSKSEKNCWRCGGPL